jgi:REP element-mobilizing transposase RayT
MATLRPARTHPTEVRADHTRGTLHHALPTRRRAWGNVLLHPDCLSAHADIAEAHAVELFRQVMKKVRAERPFRLEAQVILPDHLHTLWTLPEGDADYPTRLRLIKSGFTRSILAHLPPMLRPSSRINKGEQAVWQRRYWEHAIRDERDFHAHLDYIHINPV